MEDADQLHAEGAVYKLYNAEFKMDVFFPVPDRLTTASADLVEVYLRTEVRDRDTCGGLLLRAPAADIMVLLGTILAIAA